MLCPLVSKPHTEPSVMQSSGRGSSKPGHPVKRAWPAAQGSVPGYNSASRVVGSLCAG
jgi:hypothetical protein